MNQQLRDPIAAQIKAVLGKQTELTDEEWIHWAQTFSNGTDGTMAAAKEAAEHARRCPGPYNLTCAAQELAQAVSALLQNQPDEDTARRLTRQAQIRLTTID